MKFDKFMEHCFRILCLVTACVVFVGAVASCVRPLRASAVAVPDPWQAVENFYSRYINNSSVIIDAISEDSTNGNLDATSALGSQVLQSLALQTVFAQYCKGVYQIPYLEENWYSVPSTISPSGSGASGFYRTSADGDIKICNLLSFPYTNAGTSATFIVAPDFTFSAVAPAGVDVSFIYYTPNYRTPYYGYGMANYSNIDYTFGYSGTGLGLSDIGTGHGYGFERKIYISYSNIPVFSSSFSLSDISEYNPLCGYGSNVSLPYSDSINKETPWDYYNNTLLPYIHTTFPNVPDIYLVFPNGYDPNQDPVEPGYISPNVNFNGVGVGGLAPIILGAGAVINVAGNNINVFAPVSGQIRIDGIQLQFPLGNDNEVYIDKQKYTLPTSELDIGDHLLEVIDKYNIVVDGLDWLINGDGTITINDILYNLPIGEIETIPFDASDYVYVYEIPTMEQLNVVDATIVPLDLSSFSNGIGAFYGLGARFYHDLGLFPVLIVCLSLAGVGYAVSKLGGH